MTVVKTIGHLGLALALAMGPSACDALAPAENPPPPVAPPDTTESLPEPPSWPPPSSQWAPLTTREPELVLAMWVERARTLGLAPRRPYASGARCSAGTELPAFQPDPLFDGYNLARNPRISPTRACTLTLKGPHTVGEHRLSEFVFPETMADRLAEVLWWLDERCIDGCDPSEGGGKAVVDGWVAGNRIFWITSTAAADRCEHERLLTLGGVQPRSSWCAER